MNEPDEKALWIPAFDELEAELARVAAAERRPRLSRRVRRGGVALIAAVLLFVPVAFAVQRVVDDDAMTVEVVVPGETVKVDGQLLECPVDEGLVQQAGFDPCEAFAREVAPPLCAQADAPSWCEQARRAHGDRQGTTRDGDPLAPARGRAAE